MRARIHCAGVDDLDLVRATRRRSLADAPDAFWTTEAEEVAEPRETWHSRLAATDGITVVAIDDDADPADPGRGLGLAFGRPHHDRPGQAGLYGMWVAPEARRTGLGGALIRVVISWARDAGHRQLLLEVADTNTAAIAAYRSLGFTPTGRRGAMPAPRDHIAEHELALVLSAWADHPVPPLGGPAARQS